MSARLVIVRHGNTFEPGEAPRRIGARTDLPLVESGHAQAARLAQHFAAQGVAFDTALTSPLRRTRATAEAILAAQAAPPPLVPSDLLAEIDHGADEDRADEAVIARIGAEALAAWDERGVAPPGWQVDREARIAGWAALLAAPQPGTTLLVTSNGAARFALLSHPALHEQALRLPSLKLRTGAYSVLAIGAEGPHIVAWDARP